MPEDEQVVQPDAVPEGTPSPEGEKPKEPEAPPPQFLTKEEVKQMLAEEREKIRQSSRDISRTEIEQAQRRAKFAEERLAGYQTGLGQLDPEQAKAIQAQAELAAYRGKDAEDIRKQQEKVMIDAFEGTLTEHLTDLGINPDDKRLDWGNDLPSDHLQARQAKFLKSVSKIQKEDASAADEKRSQEMKDVETRLRKDLGIDSVDTSASGGAVETGGFAKIEQDYGEGKITYADYKKARKKYNIGG